MAASRDDPTAVPGRGGKTVRPLTTPPSDSDARPDEDAVEGRSSALVLVRGVPRFAGTRADGRDDVAEAIGRGPDESRGIGADVDVKEVAEDAAEDEEVGSRPLTPDEPP